MKVWRISEKKEEEDEISSGVSIEISGFNKFLIERVTG